MTYAQVIIEKFGGVRAAANALGRSPSTVQGWKVRGTIPDTEKPAVLSAALLCGIPLAKDDFWPTPDNPRIAQTSEDAA